MTAGHEQRIALHLVSDATGETLHAVARAAVSQFEHARVIYHRWGSVRTKAQLHRVAEGIEADPGTVLTTIMDRKLRAEFDVACEKLGVRVVHVLDPVLTMLQDTIGEPAKGRAGSQYVLDEEYYRRIDAMHYVIAHDDGQRASGLRDADVVLVGVSRTSKTPTCFYLANRGVKAANVPLVPNLPLAAELNDLRCPIIGLTIDPRTLIEIRRHRLHAIAPSGALDFIGAHDSGYVDAEIVRDEVVWARRLCARHAWPVIDVSRRSIEETAAAVIDIQEAWVARALAGRNAV